MAATPLSNPELKLETVITEDETVVRCIGKITLTSSSTLQTAMRGLIPETERLALDLTDVTYVDSSGLGALVSVNASARRQHCKLRLINVTQQGKELLRITNLASMFE